MNKHQLQGNWNELKGKVKEKWGEFTNDELDRIDGEVDQLIGALQKRYGYNLEEARREVEDWRRSSNC